MRNVVNSWFSDSGASTWLKMKILHNNGKILLDEKIFKQYLIIKVEINLAEIARHILWAVLTNFAWIAMGISCGIKNFVSWKIGLNLFAVGTHDISYDS